MSKKPPEMDMFRETRIGICIPTRDHVHGWFAYDLARLVGFSAAQGISGNLQLFMDEGTLLPRMRNTLAKRALDAGVTHLLWLDSDMRFPKHLLHALLSRREPIVGANYVRRAPPYVPTAFKNVKNKWPCWTYDDSTGLEPVESLGFGAVLISAQVFKKMNFPYFATPFDEESQEFVSEDIHFCRRADLVGYEVLIDHEVSQQVQHIGNMAFTYIHGLDTKELIERVEEDR